MNFRANSESKLKFTQKFLGYLGDFQLKKYPKISCGAGILPANNKRTGKMPIPQDWIARRCCKQFIFFVEFSSHLQMTFAMRLGIHSQAGYGFYVKLTPMSLLEQQLNPLSVLERQIMYSLATNQQLTTITNLANILPHISQYLVHFLLCWVKRQRNPTHLLGFMLQPNLQIKAFFNLDKVLISRSHFLQAIERLYSRCLIEKEAGKYTLQPVLREYVMEQFIHNL